MLQQINMTKSQCWVYGLCLFTSVLINIILTINLYVGNDGNLIKEDDNQLTWSRKAAVEAEAVAAISCSNHGRAYLDGPINVDGKHVCECNACYGGSDCSQLLPNCPATVYSGDPTFLEPFWMENAANSALLIPGWHRMSYSFTDRSATTSKELEKYIHKVHSIAGNAVTAGKYIVFGTGSSQLLIAAIYALNAGNASFPSKVVASIPFYPMYKKQTDYFDAVDFQFQGDASLFRNTSESSMNVIEFVNSPNNPDCLLKKAVLGGSSVKTIYDHAYYWPHYTHIPSPSDEDLMLFTLSKLTGHAGSRFGWALIKDKAVYERMKTYIQMAELTFSKDIQLRVLQLLKVVVEGDGKEIFNFAYQKMRDRWVRLSRAFSNSKSFSIQHIPSEYCSYFQKVRGPSPAYAWVKCERKEDKDCSQVFREANIEGVNGSAYNADNRYVRLSLILSQDEFEYLLQLVNELISKENGNIQQILFGDSDSVGSIIS